MIMNTGYQVGGSHYKELTLQPITYIQANGLDYCQGNVVKYTTRHRSKNGREDLEKAAQYCGFLMDYYSAHRVQLALRWVLAHPWLMSFPIPSRKYCNVNRIEGLARKAIRLITTWRTLDDLREVKQSLLAYADLEYPTP